MLRLVCFSPVTCFRASLLYGDCCRCLRGGLGQLIGAILGTSGAILDIATRRVPTRCICYSLSLCCFGFDLNHPVLCVLRVEGWITYIHHFRPFSRALRKELIAADNTQRYPTSLSSHLPLPYVVAAPAIGRRRVNPHA